MKVAEKERRISWYVFPRPLSAALMIVDSPVSRLVRFVARSGVALFGVLLISAWSAVAQDASAVRLLLLVEGNREIERHQLESPSEPSAAVQQFLDEWRQQGYLSARIDSIVVSDASAAEAVAYVARERRFKLSEITIAGTDESKAAFHRHSMLERGDPFDVDRIEGELARVASRLAATGHPMVRLGISSAEIAEGEAAVRLVVDVDLGPTPFVRGMEIIGSDRTSPSYLMRLSGIRRGMQLSMFDPEGIRRRVLASGHFRQVGVPALFFAADSVTVRIAVEDEPPGNFDLVFGYSPGDDGAGVIGSGRIDLQNPFGSGRSIFISLDRLPGQVSRVEALLADPFVLGTPISAAVAFEGFQQDSLFNRQRYALELGFRLDAGNEIFGTLSRRQTQPGTAGIRVEGARQRVAQADIFSFGIGFRSRRVDFNRSPTRGHALDAVVESGTSRRSLSRIIGADTTREHRSVRVDGFSASGRLYVPAGRRGVIVTGGDVSAIRGDDFDRSDLRYIGGLRTLRGYDQDQFLVRAVARGLVELRYRLDPISYINIFFDGAYLERPVTPSLDSLALWRTGYGFGGQFDTGFSLMTVAVAFNPQDGLTSPRIHAGIAFGI